MVLLWRSGHPRAPMTDSTRSTRLGLGASNNGVVVKLKAQSIAMEVGVGHEMGCRVVLGSERKMCVVRGQSSGNVGEE